MAPGEKVLRREREVPVEAKCPGAKVPARQGDDDDIYTPLFGERDIPQIYP